jgi:hypothetical protein
MLSLLAKRGRGLIPFFLCPTKEEVVLMRRIMVLMAVALVMAAIMVAMAMPAFAKSNKTYTCISVFGTTHIDVSKEQVKNNLGEFFIVCERDDKT